MEDHSISDYLTSNITLLRLIISEGCGGQRTLERRGRATEEWLAESILMKCDNDDAYTAVIEINLGGIVCCPSDPYVGSHNDWYHPSLIDNDFGVVCEK